MKKNKPAMSERGATIGIFDHGGWAVLVTVAAGGVLLDRRRVELVDEFLPKIPHHSECQTLPIPEAVALVERVNASAARYAKLGLDQVAATLSSAIGGIALRECPPWLPATVAERISDRRASNFADWVMYRQALAAAAEERGCAVHWYNAKTVLQEASAALGIADFDRRSLQIRRSIGPPWSNDHKVAMAAAIVAAKARIFSHRVL